MSESGSRGTFVFWNESEIRAMDEPNNNTFQEHKGPLALDTSLGLEDTFNLADFDDDFDEDFPEVLDNDLEKEHEQPF